MNACVIAQPITVLGKLGDLYAAAQVHRMIIIVRSGDEDEAAHYVGAAARRLGGAVVALPPPPRSVPPAVGRSYQVYAWLKAHESRCQLVQFPDREGIGYFSISAKRTGVAFANVTMIVHAHAPILWTAWVVERRHLNTIDELDTMHMEQECIAHCDVLVVTSTLLAWLRRTRWDTPLRVVVPVGRMVATRELWEGAQPSPRPPKRPPPTITVVIATFNPRKALLMAALRSLAQQSYPRNLFTVVVVDDCSDDRHSVRALAAAWKWMDRLQWTHIRTVRNLFVGEARNVGAQAARGEFVLFMDDDNVAKRDELEVFARAVQSTNASILTCPVDIFVGIPNPTARTRVVNWLPLANVHTAAFRNSLGDTNFLIRRSTFESLGGFHTDRVIYEDWEFLTRAALSGVPPLLVPVALVWKRHVQRQGMMTTANASSRFDGEVQAFRPFVKRLGWGVAAPILLAKGFIEGVKNLQPT